MKTFIQTTLCATLIAGLSSIALAKGPTPQNHHCVKDGATMEGKTRKDCKKEGGKWEKDAPADKAAGGEAKAPDAK